LGYFVYPNGVVSHVMSMEARSTDYPNPPFMPPGLLIEWRLNGSVVKTGSTSNEFDTKINTISLGDYKFKPWHANLLVDFVISGTDFSAANTLSNTDPTVSGGIEQDEYGVSPKAPRVYWSYDDVDGDRQELFRFMVGAGPGGAEYYDSGYIIGDPGDANGDGVVDEDDYNFVSERVGSVYGDANYVMKADFNRDGVIDQDDLDVVTMFMGSEYDLSQASENYTFQLPELTPGFPIFWSLQVGDGEKLNNTDPDWPEPIRKFTEIVGTSTINDPPAANTVLIDGI
jgi:hypothetical protein